MHEGDQSSHPLPGMSDSISHEKRRVLFVYFPGLPLVGSLASRISDHYFPGSGILFDYVVAFGMNLIAGGLRLPELPPGF